MGDIVRKYREENEKEMTDAKVIYEDAAREQRDTERKAGTALEEAITSARRQYWEAVAGALRVHKLRVSQTRNPYCFVCNLDPVPGYTCACHFRCPSTLCKGEE